MFTLITIKFTFYRILVASQDGYLYVYQLPTEGGECHLVKRHDLRHIDSSPPQSRPQESQPVVVPSKSSSSPPSGASYSPSKGFNSDDDQ